MPDSSRSLRASSPNRWLAFWEARHHRLRGVILAFLGYTALVTVAFFHELYSLRVWADLLFYMEGSPFTSLHAAALAGAAFAYTTQSYCRDVPPPQDSETVRSGQNPITHEEARQRIEKLFRP